MGRGRRVTRWGTGRIVPRCRKQTWLPRSGESLFRAEGECSLCIHKEPSRCVGGLGHSFDSWPEPTSPTFHGEVVLCGGVAAGLTDDNGTTRIMPGVRDCSARPVTRIGGGYGQMGSLPNDPCHQYRIGLSSLSHAVTRPSRWFGYRPMSQSTRANPEPGHYDLRSSRQGSIITTASRREEAARGQGAHMAWRSHWRALRGKVRFRIPKDRLVVILHAVPGWRPTG